MDGFSLLTPPLSPAVPAVPAVGSSAGRGGPRASLFSVPPSLLLATVDVPLPLGSTGEMRQAGLGTET